MVRLIDADLLTTKISFVGFPHTDRNGRMDKSWVYELINSCPTVDKRPHGKWEFDSWGNYCSECGHKQLTTGKFCSECGADMREENNE